MAQPRSGDRDGVRRPSLRLPRPPVNGRAAVLLLVVCGLAIAIAYPLKQYLDQRADINALRERTEQRRAEVARLKDELTRWEDPAYVRARARDDLHLVMPGDVGYIVVPPPSAEPGATPSPSATPWYERLWTSVREADQAPAPGTTPAPSTPPPTEIHDTRAVP